MICDLLEHQHLDILHREESDLSFKCVKAKMAAQGKAPGSGEWSAKDARALERIRKEIVRRQCEEISGWGS